MMYMILVTFCDIWFEGHCQGHSKTEEEGGRGILRETGAGSASRRVSRSWTIYPLPNSSIYKSMKCFYGTLNL